MPNGDISSVKFFRSYHDAAKLMCDAERLAFYDQLLAYVFDGAEPEEPTSQFVLVEPTLSRSLEVERHNNARRANGQRGGRPKKEAGPAKEDEPEDDGEFAEQAAEIVAYLNERPQRKTMDYGDEGGFLDE